MTDSAHPRHRKQLGLCRMQNEATGDITEIEIPSNGAAFDRTIMLSEPGSYHIHVGSFTIKAVYLP